MAAAKAKMIALVAEGMPAQRAMVQIGYKEDTLRIWLSRDKAFARSLEEAKTDAKNKSTKALGVELRVVLLSILRTVQNLQKVFKVPLLVSPFRITLMLQGELMLLK